MKEYIKIIVKKPGEPVGHWETIPNTLKGLQDVVEGYIEPFTFASDCFIVCNEEGLIYGLPFNCTIAGVDFVGTIGVIGADGDESTDCPLTLEDWEQWVLGKEKRHG